MDSVSEGGWDLPKATVQGGLCLAEEAFSKASGPYSVYEHCCNSPEAGKTGQNVAVKVLEAATCPTAEGEREADRQSISAIFHLSLSQWQIHYQVSFGWLNLQSTSLPHQARHPLYWQLQTLPRLPSYTPALQHSDWLSGYYLFQVSISQRLWPLLVRILRRIILPATRSSSSIQHRPLSPALDSFIQ